VLDAGTPVDVGRRALGLEEGTHRLCDVACYAEYVGWNVLVLLKRFERAAEQLTALCRCFCAAVGHDLRSRFVST